MTSTTSTRVDSASPVETAALRRAFELARRGPAMDANPRVGCVLLTPDGTTIGEGWHRGAGTPHAEVAALADAAALGNDTRGATAVVTLEPCNHTGRTGPCSEALIAARVRRVVVSVEDPNPLAAGGAARLRAEGIDVLAGVLVDEGRQVLGTWVHAVERDRPFVTLKLASTLDGRIAAADGSSRWITGEVARQHAHDLRAEVDAIAVGTGTALADDPSLTARTADGSLHGHQPLRVVVGLRDLPADAALRGPGGDLVQVRSHDPHEVLAELGRRGVRHVLVEGGPTLAAAFLRAGLVDEVHAYLAPVLLGAGRPAVDDLGITSIDGALRLVTRSVVPLGPDVLVVATPAAIPEASPEASPEAQES
ncbi:bifunctional diaminohydroxyphosphoribosylaminopyrimidine deaminase/5-amino-6-(5-phosphoribosylamino)uracil reductase RibD [Cellulomonas rhizosphaerae]|uniref:Riboflavin biosynthesis protein RibD n=1 Tax=Cellulomonas rhizosphaerae TaxID=2293719 RepID=A0A413RK41_9CELL|nr:bifunctional diaminohydroxyphosphoribosylaminopyrimidine deaminase/5-amino-6-(5-phosphoribosylamino)uracil reductase RibD [Cellulomonas rhizosphaerae]RHA39263.1 bifunctional diaminohydroxyphosphoribosylaminopyrimidine deaminase/5-amino-6-(5-phosphoribosylamino)uracil reductase RibD [Cellulomonas rhizosphaerae]